MYSQHFHYIYYILRCQPSSLDRFADVHFQFCHYALRRSVQKTCTLPHIIQICKSEWKCAGCSILESCLCLSVQIENIDACLSFLAAKGVNIQGLSSEGKLDSCTSPFTGTTKVDPNQARPSY